MRWAAAATPHRTLKAKSVQQLPPWINEAAQQNYAFAQNVAHATFAAIPRARWLLTSARRCSRPGTRPRPAGTPGRTNTTPPRPACSASARPTAGDAGGWRPGEQLSRERPISQPLHEPVHAGRDQRDAAHHAAAARAAQNQQQNQANSANAFGGSRQGIQQGVTQAQGAHEHGADGGATEPGQFRPGADARQANTGSSTSPGQSDRLAA